MDINDKFSYEIVSGQSPVTVYLRGILDEDANILPLADINGPINFNFKDISRVNSLGIRNWVNFLNRLTNKVYFSECSPAVVRQLSRVPSFIGKAIVLSVYVHYVCDSCDHEKFALIERNEFLKKPKNIQEVIECDNCKKTRMVVSDQLDQYFAFAN